LQAGKPRGVIRQGGGAMFRGSNLQSLARQKKSPHHAQNGPKIACTKKKDRSYGDTLFLCDKKAKLKSNNKENTKYSRHKPGQ